MPSHVLKQGTFDLEFVVRESDSYTKNVIVQINRITNGDKAHVTDLFLQPHQVIELGNFLRYEGIEIEVDQAREAYEAKADVEATR